MGKNRIELDGRTAGVAELRVTPAGTPVLRLVVECGAGGGRFRLAVAMTGERAAALKPRLAPGSRVRVTGALQTARTAGPPALNAQSLEVMAESIDTIDS